MLLNATGQPGELNKTVSVPSVLWYFRPNHGSGRPGFPKIKNDQLERNAVRRPRSHPAGRKCLFGHGYFVESLEFRVSAAAAADGGGSGARIGRAEAFGGRGRHRRWQKPCLSRSG